uniref:Major facilitator superfamily (MFS) profile domain-containing protein n=1 Tax=Clastoptera arizonana TaxID=38151 RepID=A0A1B6DT32_9HEMI
MDFLQKLTLKMKTLMDSNWLFIVSLIDLLGASLFMPLFATHLRSLGMSYLQIGSLSSVYFGAQLVSGPLIGNLSDIYGRKPVLLLTVSVCALCYCSFGFLLSYIVILTVRLILGISKHTQVMCKALVADIIPPDDQSKSHGKLNAIASLGFVIGPAIGGHIVEMNNGFTLVCLTTCLIFLLNSLIVWIYLPSTLKSQAKNDSLIGHIKNTFQELLDINWRTSWEILLIKFSFTMCMSLFYSNYVLTLREKFDFTQKSIGYTVSFQGLIAAISSMSINKINNFYVTDKSKFRQLYHSFIILGVSFLFLGFVNDYKMYFFVIIFLQGSAALLRVTTIEVLIEKSSSEHRGSIVGTSSSVVSSAKIVAPFISGFITDYFGQNYNSFLSFVLAIVTSYLCFIMNKRYETRKSI